MIRPLLLSLLVFFATPAFAKTYYIATNGSDSAPGNSGQPWATFDHAWAVMNSGDTLLVEDGTYFQHLRPPTSLSGKASAYTTIAAVNPWMVTVDGSTTTPSGEATLYLNGMSYMMVRGIKFASSPSSTSMLGPLSVYYSDHIKILQTAAYNAPCAGNVAVFDIGPSSSYILVEDSHAWGCGRYKFLAYQSDHIIFRHNVSRHDYHDVTGWPNTPDGWGRQSATYTMYDSTNVLMQNNISIDSGKADFSTGVIYGGIWSENNGAVNNSGKYEGDIFVNVISGPNYNSTINDPKLLGTREASNIVIVNCKSGYVLGRGDGTAVTGSFLASHMTLANLTGTNADDGAPGDGVGVILDNPTNMTQRIIKDSVIQQAHSVGVAASMLSDYNIFYQNAANFGPVFYQGATPTAGTHDRTNTNPLLKYPVRVEAGTPGKGTASDGGDVGATVLYRIGTPGTLWGETGYDTLTSTPLWPWQDEAVIKTDMASFSMTNPVVGGTITGARGFAAPGTGLYGGPITLTSYIWEQLGNACPADVCPAVTRTLTAVAVSPGSASTLAGGTSQFTATCTYSDRSTADCSNTVTWSSSSPAVATISSAGLAAGVAAGSTTIKAASGSLSGTAVLTVTNATLTAIAVTPATASIVAGSGSQQFAARCTYSNSTSADCTGTVTWSSSSPAVATISSAGLAAGVAAGSTTIKAASGSLSGTAVLTVTNATLTAIAVTPATASIVAGTGSQQYAARCTYSNSTTSDCTGTVTWSSSSPAVATISSAGRAAGVTAGTTNIKAASGSLSGTAVLTVTNATLTAIAVTPATASIVAGSGSQQYAARCTYSNSTSADCTGTVTWSSSSPAVATISSAGRAAGVAAGTTTIKAASGSLSGTTTLTVTNATLTAIAVTPATSSIVAGSGSQQYAARCTYSNSTTSDCTGTVTWSSSSPAVATISSAGLAAGVAAGSTTIKAASGSLSGTAVLTVTPQTPPVDLKDGIWAWMSGSSTTPGAPNGRTGVYSTLGEPSPGGAPGSRKSSVSWTDRDGNLWLFGGRGFDSADVDGSLNDLWEFLPSSEEWAWMGGKSTVPEANKGWPGVYGTLGAPASTNIPGGRIGAASWTDRAGNLWLFGGTGFDAAGTNGSLNDLWEYNIATKNWVWKGGSSTVPAASNGQPGVYGNLGVSNAANIPGGRSGASSWTDLNGNFWLFGGVGFDSTGSRGCLNDLWELDPSTGKWTWMSGSRVVGSGGGQPGLYGSLGSAAENNIPSGRTHAVNWIDRGGHLWLFGGKGLDSSGTLGYLNDVWEFNPSTRLWAWMGGGSTVACHDCGNPGTYGTHGEADSANIPGGRDQAIGWTDGDGNFWLLGGNGFDSDGTKGVLNDLWELFPATSQWAWMGGSSTVPAANSGQPGVYGTLRVPSAANAPGARSGGSGWTDGDGNLWLFGGRGFDSKGTNGDLDDLWAYQLSAGTLAAATPTLSVPSGTYGTAQSVTIGEATPGATIHYTIDGTSPNAHSSVYKSPITVSKTMTIKAIATAAGYNASAIASATYTITTKASFTIALQSGSVRNVTVKPGAAATYSLVVTPVGTTTLPAAITLSAIGIPPGATAAFTPSTVTAGLGVTTVSLAVQTHSITTAKAAKRSQWPVALCLLVLPLFGMRRWRRSGTPWSALMRMFAGFMLLTGITMALNGCANTVILKEPGSGLGTTYTITVTGTSGTATETTTVAITVQ